ncbi:MAG: DUF2269 domain-containing protein [Gemmatimonadetes bacterium]|nr:DUF2269 domain-containing protein [Gemmatimonadota bacterium]
MYELILALHIIAVVVAFGPVFSYFVGLRAARSTGPAALAAFHRGQVLLVRYATIAMVVVLAAGLYLALDRWSLGDPWISATFLILLVLFGLYGAFLAPTERRAAELAGGGGPTPGGEYDAAARRLSLVMTLASVLVAVAIVLMTVKPGA